MEEEGIASPLTHNSTSPKLVSKLYCADRDPKAGSFRVGDGSPAMDACCSGSQGNGPGRPVAWGATRESTEKL